MATKKNRKEMEIVYDKVYERSVKLEKVMDMIME